LLYQGNKLFLYIVCAIAAIVDRTLRNTFNGIVYFVKIVAMTSLMASSVASDFNWIPGLY